jgi:hypothetical protein
MRDAPTPATIAWFRLAPRHRLVMMYAIADVFPVIKNARAWTAGINEALANLKPTSQEHEDILIESGQISRTLKRQLKSDEPGQ